MSISGPCSLVSATPPPRVPVCFPPSPRLHFHVLETSLSLFLFVDCMSCVRLKNFLEEMSFFAAVIDLHSTQQIAWHFYAFSYL